MSFDVFCFVKQRTAYEMHISDWSSDVCSSDQPHDRAARHRLPVLEHGDLGAESAGALHEFGGRPRVQAALVGDQQHPTRRHRRDPATGRRYDPDPPSMSAVRAAEDLGGRSEEHTSELQSLMRISYAVFCLKKKKKQYTYR